MKRLLFLVGLLALILLLLAPPVLAGHKPGHQVPPGCQKPPAESSPGCQRHQGAGHYPPGCQKPPAQDSPGCQKHQASASAAKRARLTRTSSEAGVPVTVGMVTVLALSLTAGGWLIHRRRRFASLKA